MERGRLITAKKLREEHKKLLVETGLGAWDIFNELDEKFFGIKEENEVTELHCIGLINKLDAVLKNEHMDHYHRVIVAKQLIEDYREKE